MDAVFAGQGSLAGLADLGVGPDGERALAAVNPRMLAMLLRSKEPAKESITGWSEL